MRSQRFLSLAPMPFGGSFRAAKRLGAKAKAGATRAAPNAQEFLLCYLIIYAISALQMRSLRRHGRCRFSTDTHYFPHQCGGFVNAKDIAVQGASGVAAVQSAHEPKWLIMIRVSNYGNIRHSTGNDERCFVRRIPLELCRIRPRFLLNKQAPRRNVSRSADRRTIG